MEIFLSSCCLRSEKIGDIVSALAKNGIRNIELSGGTKYYKNCISDLIRLKKKYRLRYLVHNYFPPSRNEFVMNLASLKSGVVKKSLNLAKRSIQFCKELRSPSYSIHAGFLVELKPYELSHPLKYRKIEQAERRISDFVENYEELYGYAVKNGVKLFLENNVYSLQNYMRFGKEKPFMLITHNDYLCLKNRLKFNFLLDIAHLRVSCDSLGLKFSSELKNFFSETLKYVHISENDGKKDLHLPLYSGKVLRNLPDSVETVTLEIRSKMFEQIFYSYKKAVKILKGKKDGD